MGAFEAPGLGLRYFMIKVLLFGELEELAGTREVSMPGTRVLEVLTALASLYGKEFRDIVLGGTGENGIIILVNNAPVRHNVFETPLADGDVVSLMPLFDA